MEEKQKTNNSEIQVSLFASSNRPQLYESFFRSLSGTSVNYEVIFSGNCKYGCNLLGEEDYYNHNINGIDFTFDRPIFQYIPTSNIKPAQCYEIARRACKGEVVVWVADDCEFPDDVIGKAYKYWKSKRNEKLILSIQTKESGYGLPQGQLFDMDNHRFFGGVKTSPLMAPLGLMSRKFLDELGGVDRRYICGQYENDIVMRAYLKGAKVEIFGDENCFIDIDHLGKSLMIGESKKESDFLRRPFATGYVHDRSILEGSWSIVGGMYIRNDAFEPFEDIDLLTKSQGPKGKWV